MNKSIFAFTLSFELKLALLPGAAKRPVSVGAILR
jgi:hypothetical protein